MNPKMKKISALQTTRIWESSEENEMKKKNGAETLVGSTAWAKICYKVFCLMTYIVFILFLLFLVSMVFFIQLLQLNCCIHVLLQLRSSFSGSSCFSLGNNNFYFVFLFLDGEKSFLFWWIYFVHDLPLKRWKKNPRINIWKSVKKNYRRNEWILLGIPFCLAAHAGHLLGLFLNLFLTIEVHYSWL